MPKGSTAASTDDYHTDKNLASFFRLPKSSGFKRPARLNSEAAIEEIQHSLFHETDIPCPIRIPFMGPGGESSTAGGAGFVCSPKALHLCCGGHLFHKQTLKWPQRRCCETQTHLHKIKTSSFRAILFVREQNVFIWCCHHLHQSSSLYIQCWVWCQNSSVRQKLGHEWCKKK